MTANNDHPTAPATPPPAETGTPTPEAVLISAVSILEHNGSVAIEVGKQLRDAIAELVRERDQYQRMLLQSDNDKGALRHSLAAAEALLEKRTGALELTRKELRDALDCLVDRGVTDDETDGYKDGQSALDAAEAALALTPEQALAEKEGTCH